MGLTVQSPLFGKQAADAILQSTQKVIEQLPSQGSILFVGSEHAIPAIKLAIASDFKVRAIDRSQGNLSRETPQTGADFELVASWDEFEPEECFVAVFAPFSLQGLGSARSRSAIYRMADWLTLDGRLIVVIPSPEEHQAAKPRLQALCEAAGLQPVKQATVPIQSDLLGTHALVEFVKKERHSIMGPYPLPDSYRGPIELSEAAWKPFVERLNRDEFDFMLDVLADNQKVLDVGSGYGKLPFELAKRTGKAYSIEPNPDRNAMQEAKAREHGVEVAQGSAEKIPYPDAFFDATAAMWVLHYVNDLEQSLKEMVRVTDRRAPGAKIVIVQGAPYNEVIGHINDSCMPLSATGQPSHQGYLLHRAAEVFKESGFGNISLHAVDSVCEFPESDLHERCRLASEIIAGHWGLGEENFERMKEALIPQLKLHFEERPHGIGDQAAVLVARAVRSD